MSEKIVDKFLNIGDDLQRSVHKTGISQVRESTRAFKTGDLSIIFNFGKIKFFSEILMVLRDSLRVTRAIWVYDRLHLESSEGASLFIA